MVKSGKRKIKGKTARERTARKRALRSVEALRVERKKSRTNQQAFGSLLLRAKVRHGIKGRPFAEMPEGKAIQYLDKRLIPDLKEQRRIKAGLNSRRRKGEQVSTKKEKAIRKLFGTGKLGIILVKPEMLASSGAIRAFLKKNGFEIIFKNAFTFGNEDLVRLYSHTLADRKTFGRFTTQMLSLLNAPSQIVVFRQQSIESYRYIAGRYHINAKIAKNTAPQDAFAAVFKDFLRTRFTAKEFRSKGFEKGVASISTKSIDAIGFFEHSANQRANPLVVVNGIHVPVGNELLVDVRTLLTLSELERLQKRVGKK